MGQFTGWGGGIRDSIFKQLWDFEEYDSIRLEQDWFREDTNYTGLRDLVLSWITGGMDSFGDEDPILLRDTQAIFLTI